MTGGAEKDKTCWEAARDKVKRLKETEAVTYAFNTRDAEAGQPSIQDKTQSQNNNRVGSVAQQGRTPAVKTDHLSLLPETHMVGGETGLSSDATFHLPPRYQRNKCEFGAQP